MDKLLLFLFLWCIQTSSLMAETIQLVWQLDQEGSGERLTVKGANRAQSFCLYTDSLAAIPILGDWEKRRNQQSFVPVLPLHSGRSYYLQDLQSQEWYISIVPLRANIVDAVAPQVVNVYPTASALPENALRFYIAFSQPMQEDAFLDAVQLLDEAGQDLIGVFLPSRFEYWNKERTVLTLLLDPGRVKEGLLANQKWGRAIQAGQTYTLRINSNCLAMNGHTLAKSFEKNFQVLPADHSVIKPSDWQTVVPPSKSKERFQVYFHRVMDYFDCQNRIFLVDENNRRVEGKWLLLEGERKASFVPKRKWKKHTYSLVVDQRLEDVCGNNLIHGFDVLEASQVAEKQQSKWTYLPIILPDP